MPRANKKNVSEFDELNGVAVKSKITLFYSSIGSFPVVKDGIEKGPERKKSFAFPFLEKSFASLA